MVEAAHDLAELARAERSGERRGAEHASGMSPAGLAADTKAIERVTHERELHAGL